MERQPEQSPLAARRDAVVDVQEGSRAARPVRRERQDRAALLDHVERAAPVPGMGQEHGAVQLRGERLERHGDGAKPFTPGRRSGRRRR